MVLYIFILIGWFGCISICYYVIRPIRNKLIRFVLTFFLCILLTCISCQNLPQFNVFTILIVTICWLTSINLIHATVFLENIALTFQSFLLKILWIYFPILPKRSAKYHWPLIFDIISIIIKFLINHWIYRWFINCNTRADCGRIFMFFIFLITMPYIIDAERILVRIVTKDKYTLECFTNFPLLSVSLREFWGQRYNRLVNSVLREGIFQPIRLEFSSATYGGVITFIISGLFHAHIFFIVFNDISSLFSTFLFFCLHGIACCFEANIKIQFDEHVGWLITNTFLLVTAPLILKPIIEEGSPFFIRNPPPLFNTTWIPQLPIPSFCP